MNLEKFKNLIIKCPHCGCEYHLAEIFMPTDIIGEPHDIVRDEDENIIYFEDTKLDSVQTYECYNCNTKFTVEAYITTEIAANPESDISEVDYFEDNIFEDKSIQL